MPEAICNTSPLLYLYRTSAVEWLPRIFTEIRTPTAVLEELREGQRKGHDVPDPAYFGWLKIVDPRATPSEWLSLDLGPGELAAMALALENATQIVLLDDMLARRTIQAAGLTVWGTPKVLRAAKRQGFLDKVESPVTRLSETGMWVSDEIRERFSAGR